MLLHTHPLSGGGCYGFSKAQQNSFLFIDCFQSQSVDEIFFFFFQITLAFLLTMQLTQARGVVSVSLRCTGHTAVGREI